MALQLWDTLKEAITAPYAATFFTVLALLAAIYYVLAGLFRSPRDHHLQSRASEEAKDPHSPPVQAPLSEITIKEERKQSDGSETDHVAQSSSQFFMASSSSSHPPRYQVVLSFRGEDTRHNFTSHLLEAMKNRGINVFFDEEKLEKGEELLSSTLNAIEASNVSIVILSKDYASSKSCLTELCKIMECKLTQGQIVLPIFYQVNPSDVRHHTGSFKQSFDQHFIKNPKEVQRWKDVFAQVGSLKGWHIDGGNSGRSETKYIKDIVEVVIKKLSSKATSESEELFGIDYQIEKILSLIEQEHIRVIGIWGMGGIGKTTLAEAVYNEISPKFTDSCFIQNVCEKVEKQGMETLRDELVSKLLNQNIRIETPSVTCTLIQERLRNKKVFVVLDDVNKSNQIEHLGVKHFGPGSKIIITSRDRQVLKNNEVNELHHVKVLNEDNSLQLFSKFAFKQYNPDADFRDLAMRFLGYAGGNPLALKVLGAALYQKSRDEWESALDKLEEYPEEDIFGPLKISLDGLGPLERNIFLDIACFFSGEDKGDVTKILNRCYRGAEFGISKLIDRCLVEVRSYVHDYHHDLGMHDLLQEMGREIVRQESEDPGRRSRLWSLEDVYHVLQNNKGTESIKGISLDVSQIKTALQICPDIFEKMVNLLFMRFQNGTNKLLLPDQNLTYLPNALRYFHWDDCPLKSFPSNFSANNLVELRLPRSNIKQLWNGDQDVVNLRVMDLGGCKNLRKIPSLLGATKLEKLSCDACESLAELPCMKHLTSLKKLELNYCPIIKFPEIPINGALEKLSLSGTQIEEVPSLIGSLKKLQSLDMSRTRIQNIPSSIVKLDALESINLSDCLNITELNLSMAPLEEVPSSISGLQKSLAALDVVNCKSLKSLSNLPPWLQFLRASGCPLLERVSFINHDLYHYYIRALRFLSQYEFNNCFNLSQDALNNIMAGCPLFKCRSIAKEFAKVLAEKKLNDLHEFASTRNVNVYVPGSEVPETFENQNGNSSITVKLGSATSKRFLCFALCLVLPIDHSEHSQMLSIHCEYQLKGIDDGHDQIFEREWFCHVRAGCSGEYLFFLSRHDMIHRDMNYEEASFAFRVFGSRNEVVEKCGVHVFDVDAESFTVSDVGSSIINGSSDEVNRCSPHIIQPNSLVGPDQLSQEFGLHNRDFGGSMVEEHANVENDLDELL